VSAMGGDQIKRKLGASQGGGGTAMDQLTVSTTLRILNEARGASPPRPPSNGYMRRAFND
jgi:hypothetical protein